MKFYKKPIFTGFAPNLKLQDVKNACAFLFLPRQWKNWRVGDCSKKVEEMLKNYFNSKYAFTFDSGRSALFFALKSLGIKQGDEVLVQAYTCVVVINAIIWSGAKPVYVDVSDDFNINPEDLKKKISSKSRVLIIQHTFGLPAKMGGLTQIAKKHNLKIIEDCAHSLGAKYNNQPTGTFGDIGMFSFGSDKMVSCARGGALTTNNEGIAQILAKYSQNLQLFSKFKLFQHLIGLPIFWIAKPLYNLWIGKLFLKVSQIANLMYKIIEKKEKRGERVKFYPAQLPNALAQILLNQMSSLETLIKHRKKIANIYHENIRNSAVVKPEWNEKSVWLRYTILVQHPAKLHRLAKKEGIILGNWYDTPIAPQDVDLTVMNYRYGMCPNDEKLAQMSVNLPTDFCITEKDAKKIIELINGL